MTITPERLAEIQGRTDNATPGPWGVGNRTEIALDAKQDSPGCFSYTVKLATVIEDDDRQDDVYYLNPATQPRAVASAEDDALFIAHARQDVEDLLAEVKQLRALHKAAQALYRAHVIGASLPDEQYARALYERQAALDALTPEQVAVLAGDDEQDGAR